MPRPSKQQPIRCQYFAWRLFQRDGVWYADGRNGETKLGKHSLGTRDQDEALSELAQLDAHMAVKQGRATAETLVRPADISIEEGWKLYLDHAGRSQGMGGVAHKSLKRYQSIRDKHQPWCRANGITAWRQFDRKMFEKYGDWIFRHYAYRTCYTDLTQIKSVVKWLIAEQRLPESSRIVYKLQKADGSDTYCPRPVEVQAMVDYCLARPELLWLGHVLFALAHLGLRIGELAALRWSDVDLAEGFVRVADERASSKKTRAGTARTTKGRRSRVIPIHPQLRQQLEQFERRPDGRVFHAPKGGKLHPDNARAILIRDVVEPLTADFPTADGEIGFSAVRFHSLRHYFCSQCFLGGASEGEIREWMGHRDSKIVELYRHLRREDATRKMHAISFLAG
jgi:integrase